MSDVIANPDDVKLGDFLRSLPDGPDFLLRRTPRTVNEMDNNRWYAFLDSRNFGYYEAWGSTAHEAVENLQNVISGWWEKRP